MIFRGQLPGGEYGLRHACRVRACLPRSGSLPWRAKPAYEHVSQRGTRDAGLALVSSFFWMAVSESELSSNGLGEHGQRYQLFLISRLWRQDSARIVAHSDLCSWSGGDGTR